MEKNGFLKLVIVALIAIIFGLGYYIFANKDNGENNNNVEENNTSDELKEVAFDEVKYLYDNINVYNGSCAEYYNYYYKNNELKVEDMSDDFKISLALYRAYVDHKTKVDSANSSSAGYTMYIAEETLNDYFNNIFSSDISYDTNKVNNGGFKAGYPFVYENNKFYLPSMGCQSEIEMFREVIKTAKNSQIIEIYEKIAYLKKDKFPSQFGEIKTSIDSDSNIGTFDDINQVTSEFMKPYLDKLETYKYTFEYIDKDNAYKFTKVEKVQ